jgi:site-specific recombinase XerD
MRPKDSKKDRLPIMPEQYDRIVYLTKKDKHIKQNTKKKLLRAYGLLYCLGARVSEITDFTMEDMRYLFRHKEIILTHTKSNAIQRLFIVEEALEIVKALDFSDVDEYLFYKNKSSESMSVGGLTKLINTHLAHQLNVLYTSHSFRAGYITRIIEMTGDIKAAQELARHKDISITLKYQKVTDDRKRKVLSTVFKRK